MVHKIYDVITRALLWVCGILICAVVLLVTVNVILRTLFNAPIKGTVEYVQYLILFIAVMVLGRTCFEDKHIYVTIVTDRIPRKARLIIYAVGRFICAAVLVIMTYQLFSSVPGYLTRTTEVLKIPYYLLYVVMGIGMALATISFALQACFYLAEAGKNEEVKEEKA